MRMKILLVLFFLQMFSNFVVIVNYLKLSDICACEKNGHIEKNCACFERKIKEQMDKKKSFN